MGSTARLLTHEDGPPTVIVPAEWDPATVEASAPVVVDAGAGAGGTGRRAVAAAMARAPRAERELDERLQPWRTAYPSVQVVAVAIDRHPVAALLDQAASSELLVVRRGPTASAVVEYAECPVAVV